MKEEYLSPFVEAATRISQVYFGGTAKIIGEERQKNLMMDKDLVIALGFMGELKGMALFGFDKEDAEVMAKKAWILMGMDEDKFDPENPEHIESTLKEFGNQVMGAATMLYGAKNYQCNITFPRIIKSEQLGVFPYECVRLKLENDRVIELKLNLEQR